jgi:hypothetical protein
MLTISVKRLPVWPRIFFACTRSTKSSMRLSTSHTSVTPATSSATLSDILARSALIRSPANIASMASGTCASFASRASSLRVVAVTWFFE